MRRERRPGHARHLGEIASPSRVRATQRGGEQFGTEIVGDDNVEEDVERVAAPSVSDIGHCAYHESSVLSSVDVADS